jgi:aminoglycoside/choline kinase family phosphotransferase
VWEREARFYDELAPLLGVRVPEVHVNHADTARGEYVIVMEDLAPMRAADQVHGATPAQARRVIDELAALHGAWWDDPRLHELPWMPGLDSPMTGAIKPMFDMGWPQFVERYRDRLAPRTLVWAQAFSERVPELLARYLTEPVTLVHGDFRLDNMFFDAGGDAAGPFALVDWQMAMRSPGGSDLVYFIVTNLTPPVRREMERELVERYQAGLAAAGVTGTYATVERLWQGYLEGVLFYTVTFGGGLLGIDPANERGVALFDELVTRTYTAADDLAVGDLLGIG